MKYLLIFFIMLFCFLIGYYFKFKKKEEYDFLVYLKNFSQQLNSNINLFKKNILAIIFEFTKNQDEKSAKFNEIFKKNDKIMTISREYLENVISNEFDRNTIFEFLDKIGSNSYEFEEYKIVSFSNYLDEKLKEYRENITKKGDLILKISLAIGAVISILIW